MSDLLLLLFVIFGPAGILFLLGVLGIYRISCKTVPEWRLILEYFGISLFLVTCVRLIFYNIEVSMTAGEGFGWAVLYSFKANIILVPSLNIVFSLLFVFIGFFQRRENKRLSALNT